MPVKNLKVTDKLVVSQLEREDNILMDITGLTEQHDQLINLQNDSVDGRTSSHNTRFEYELFFDRDIVTIKRSVYNTFMLLGDIGGF